MAGAYVFFSTSYEDRLCKGGSNIPLCESLSFYFCIKTFYINELNT